LMLTDNLWSYLQGYAEKHRLAGNGFGFSLADRGGVTRTLSARYYKDGSEILIQEQGFPNPRRLSPQEARQLMGYTNKFLPFLANPKGFEQVVSDVQSYKQFGNSVVPEIVALIGEEIREMLRFLD
jgi:DNA (cytosine-5)-methyltransferase 1